MPGTIISPVEVFQVSKYGLWLAHGDTEYFLDFESFPWFSEGSIAEVCDVEEVSPGHFHWPQLDIDLDIDRILQPEQYPLVARRTVPHSRGAAR